MESSEQQRGMENRLFFYGNREAPLYLIQPVDESDAQGLAEEWEKLQALTGGKKVCLLGFLVTSWSTDLTPWPAPPAFGKEPFGEGAGQTLSWLREEVLSSLGEGKRFYLGGYSLAGLFVLWASYQTSLFEGIAAVSPSVWYPGWRDYARDHECQAKRVYLSLGDKEERTRNRTMATVGESIRWQEERLKEEGKEVTLEWNAGNHFQDAPGRTARGFAWLLR